MTQDLYQILGVNRNATSQEIKKAFHDLSKIHHPDMGGDEEEFKKISEAYTVLMDDGSRKHYEDFGCVPGSEEAEHMLVVINSLCILWDQLAAKLTSKELEKYDLIGIMKDGIKKKIIQQEGVVDETEETLQKISKLKEVLASRLKRKTSKRPTPNFFIGTLEKRISMISGQLKDQKYQLTVAKDMLNIIGEYDFEFDSATAYSGMIGQFKIQHMDGLGNKDNLGWMRGGFK